MSFNYAESPIMLKASGRVLPVPPAHHPPVGNRPTPRALGMNDELAHSFIRFSLGRFTTEEEIYFTPLIRFVNYWSA
ncbi:hypothetical protein KCP73_20015 [Salmonella enterica subsp. enterica]|nr:hypothetical protein KCP73_20015 [Salmonella enterica subsp. enterica]